MQHTNPVFQVLVTSTPSGSPATGQAVLAKDLTPADLKHGQIGFFNAHTGKSIDASSPSDQYKDYYIYVGVNRTNPLAAAPPEDIQGSAGYYIQPRHTTAITVKGYMPETPKIVEVVGFTALCQTNYCIKVEIRNQQSYQINGFNGMTKPYCYYTGCCGITPCGDCPPAASGAEVAQGLAALINADPDKLLIASTSSTKAAGTFGAATTAGNVIVTVGNTAYTVPVAAGDTNTAVAAKVAAQINTQGGTPYSAATSATAGQVNIFANSTTAGAPTGTVTLTSAGGTGVTLGTVTAFTKTAYTDYTTLGPSAGGTLTITANPTASPTFGGALPHKYFKGGTDFVVSLTDGLGLCNGTVNTVQEAIFPDGKAVDLKYLEYVAGGWNGKPGVYRQLSLTGWEKDDIEYFTNPGVNYNVLIVSNDIESVSGNMTTYRNPVATYIAIPCAETATLQGVAAILDKIYAGRFELTADAAALSCSNQPTKALAAGATGIEFVA